MAESRGGVGTGCAARPFFLRPGAIVRMLTIAGAGVLLPVTAAAAQLLERPWLGWETVSVGRFDVHFSGALGVGALCCRAHGGRR